MHLLAVGRRAHNVLVALVKVCVVDTNSQVALARRRWGWRRQRRRLAAAAVFQVRIQLRLVRGEGTTVSERGGYASVVFLRAHRPKEPIMSTAAVEQRVLNGALQPAPNADARASRRWWVLLQLLVSLDGVARTLQHRIRRLLPRQVI